MSRIVLLVTFLLSGLLNSVSQASEETFWQLLESGNKVLLVRHATLSEEFGSPFILDGSCFSERNLSDFGREQARWINQQLKGHAVVVEAVMASPHCRTQETAQLLAEGLQQVTINPSLRLTKAVKPEVAQQNMAATRDLIRNYQGKGVLILVTHRPNIGELIYQSIEPAEMVIVEPFAGDTFEVLARLQVPMINPNK